MKRPVSIALASLLLGGCITYSVDESWFFKPAPVATKATMESELRLDREERLASQTPFSASVARVFPNFPDRIPARLTHAFVPLGGQRIAMTRVAGANGDDEEPLIVYCGGESGSRRDAGDYWATKLLPWGEALLFDVPGYGDSTGQPTIEALLAFQNDPPGYIDGLAADRPLILWGHSLDGPVCAAVAAASRQVDAVILETTASNFADVIEASKPWFTPPGLQLELVDGLKGYDVPKALATFKGPIMVLAAGKDTTFPVSLERSVADRLKRQGNAVLYLEYASADHMNSAMNSRFVKDAVGFFADIGNIRQ